MLKQNGTNAVWAYISAEKYSPAFIFLLPLVTTPLGAVSEKQVKPLRKLCADDSRKELTWLVIF